jgi:hypothetical protein
MPRKNHRRRGQRRGRPGQPRGRAHITTLYGTVTFSVSISSSSAAPSITLGNLSNATGFPATRVYRAAQLFSLFRFTSVRLRFLDNTLSTSCGIAFAPSSQQNVPNGFSTASEYERFSVSLIGATVPSHMNIGRRELLGVQATKWFSTNASSETPAVQGTLYFVAGSASIITCQMTYVLEFCDSVAFEYTVPETNWVDESPSTQTPTEIVEEKKALQQHLIPTPVHKPPPLWPQLKK